MVSSKSWEVCESACSTELARWHRDPPGSSQQAAPFFVPFEGDDTLSDTSIYAKKAPVDEKHRRRLTDVCDEMKARASLPERKAGNPFGVLSG